MVFPKALNELLKIHHLDDSYFVSRDESDLSFFHNFLDDYNLESLLILKNVLQENMDFGYLFRPYWIPATSLEYKHSMFFDTEDYARSKFESYFLKNMLCCQSNRIIWQEIHRSLQKNTGDELLRKFTFEYDCFNYKLSYFPTIADQDLFDEKAKENALIIMPFIFPPGPQCRGASWSAKLKRSFMNYNFVSVEYCNGKAIAIIKKEGEYTLSLPLDEKSNREVVAGFECKGISFFDLDRNVTLESRSTNRFISSENECRDINGLVFFTRTSLFRSSSFTPNK